MGIRKKGVQCKETHVSSTPGSIIVDSCVLLVESDDGSLAIKIIMKENFDLSFQITVLDLKVISDKNGAIFTQVIK